MSKTVVINSAVSLASAMTMLAEEFREHKYVEIEIRQRAKQRTLTQNRALHLFLGQLCDVLNDAGLDMRAVLKQDVELPWTVENAKEYLWRPIQEALTGKRSTTEITTVEPTVIHETLARHLGEKLGIACPPWPCRENRRVA